MTRSGQETEHLDRLMRKRWGGRHRWYCVYCGRPANTIDHFIPERLGGTSEPQNLVPACQTCNSRKMDLEPAAWMKAVGVPFERAQRLWIITHSPDYTTLMTKPPSRLILDYAAGKALRRPSGPFQGS